MIQAVFGLRKPDDLLPLARDREPLETTDRMTATKLINKIPAPVLALDLGQKLVGAAVSDELLVTIKRLTPLKRSNWKRLLQEVRALIERFDAQTLVIGLPLRLDGTVGDAARDAQRIASNFALSLPLPVYLQDERLTSFEAQANLKDEGHPPEDIQSLIDGESAAMILRDFLNSDQERRPCSPTRSPKSEETTDE